MKITPAIRREVNKVSRRLSLEGKSDRDIFYDLCFCLCAPQTRFTYNKQVDENLKQMRFYEKGATRAKLHKATRPARFYKTKTEFLLAARRQLPEILEVVRGSLSDVEKRSWLAKNVRGFGLKAASHFLRNLGARDLAIIDVHILKFMGEVPPNGNGKYLSLEGKLRGMARKMGLSVGELDMVVWKEYSHTPWKEFTA